MREACARADSGLLALQRALLAQAERHSGTIMPGFTHMQPAQPVTFGHHCLAYVEMAARDRGRFGDAAKRLNESPLGAAALAGTAFPIDRDLTAAALGFDRPAASAQFPPTPHNMNRKPERQEASGGDRPIDDSRDPAPGDVGERVLADVATDVELVGELVAMLTQLGHALLSRSSVAFSLAASFALRHACAARQRDSPRVFPPCRSP